MLDNKWHFFANGVLSGRRRVVFVVERRDLLRNQPDQKYDHRADEP